MIIKPELICKAINYYYGCIQFPQTLFQTLNNSHSELRYSNEGHFIHHISAPNVL